jgi:wyosine [tRNA(Phe)-imidazoG37] synthetase (radical SAM superfamily)
MKNVPVKKTTFDKMQKLLQDLPTKTQASQEIATELEAIERRLKDTDIDTISQVISNDAHDFVDVFKKIMADGKVTIMDAPQAITLGALIYNVIKKAGAVKAEVSDLSLFEVRLLIDDALDSYEEIAEIKQAVFIGALEKK